MLKKVETTDVYEYLIINNTEKTEIIFDKIINKLLELNEKLKKNQCQNIKIIIELQKSLIKILPYFKDDNSRKVYDEILYNQKKEKESFSKSIIFTDLTQKIKNLKKEFNMNVDIDNIKLVKIIEFIADISNQCYREIKSRISNYNFAMNFITRVFSCAHSNNRNTVLIEDFILVALENEKLTSFYREKFAVDIFNNWYPVLKK